MSCMTARQMPKSETHSQDADGCVVSGASRLTPKRTGKTHRIDAWRTFAWGSDVRDGDKTDRLYVILARR